MQPFQTARPIAAWAIPQTDPYIDNWLLKLFVHVDCAYLTRCCIKAGCSGHVQLTLSSKRVLKRQCYRSNLKLGTAKTITVIVFKMDRSGFYSAVMRQKNADELANSVDPD